MKPLTLISIALWLSLTACQPAALVPTVTPILAPSPMATPLSTVTPTITPDPSIRALTGGWKLKLGADGIVEQFLAPDGMSSADAQAELAKLNLPGAKWISKDGKYVAIDDNGKEVAIIAIDEQAANWEVALSLTPEMNQAFLDIEKYGVSRADYHAEQSADGVVRIYDNKGELIYVNGEYSLRFLVDRLDREALVGTDIEPINGSWHNPPQFDGGYSMELIYRSQVKAKIIELLGINNWMKDGGFSYIFLGENKNGNVWGLVICNRVTNQELLLVEQSDHSVTYTPIITISPDEIFRFYE